VADMLRYEQQKPEALDTKIEKTIRNGVLKARDSINCKVRFHVCIQSGFNSTSNLESKILRAKPAEQLFQYDADK
jgi:hypothetical protein